MNICTAQATGPEPVDAPSQQRHPARELLARYKASFQAAWANRTQLVGPKLMADEAAFLPAACWQSEAMDRDAAKPNLKNRTSLEG